MGRRLLNPWKILTIYSKHLTSDILLQRVQSQGLKRSVYHGILPHIPISPNHHHSVRWFSHFPSSNLHWVWGFSVTEDLSTFTAIFRWWRKPAAPLCTWPLKFFRAVTPSFVMSGAAQWWSLSWSAASHSSAISLNGSWSRHDSRLAKTPKYDGVVQGQWRFI